ncbi:MAG: TIGR03905 family TSCPD domain-containing protein [Clostridia bacterium]|nr:TIGR03905 family TSCPD domain-containing protein [Clostridia bacterium]
MDRFHYQTKGVCSRSIDVEIEDGVIQSVQFHGGCAGNTQGVAALIRGMRVEEAIERLSGIRCGLKSTSCPDQLSAALREYLAKN